MNTVISLKVWLSWYYHENLFYLLIKKVYYDRINVTQRIDSKETNNLPEYVVFHYNYIVHNFLLTCMWWMPWFDENIYGF